MNSLTFRQMNINMSAIKPTPQPKPSQTNSFTSKTNKFTTIIEYLEDEPTKTKIKTTTVWFDKKTNQNKRKVSFEVYDH